VGRDCYIKNAIIDKNARIGDGAYLSPEGQADCTNQYYSIREGVIVIPKNAVIPAGFHV
jgi:glucose-1-phosphate adenylyltransferase